MIGDDQCCQELNHGVLAVSWGGRLVWSVGKRGLLLGRCGTATSAARAVDQATEPALSGSPAPCSPLPQVGYDMSGEHPHYIVKNSWGDSWGEQVCRAERAQGCIASRRAGAVSGSLQL